MGEAGPTPAAPGRGSEGLSISGSSGPSGSRGGGGIISGDDVIVRAFELARDEGRAALMPYMMAGFPDQATSLAVAEAYVEGGADLIELGVPFSDPLADGPTIHAAATAALAAGATPASALDVCASVADRVPVVLMAYANTVLAHGGADEFARRAAEAGAAGGIVPDLPLGEAEKLRDAFASAGLALVPLLAPTTTPERREAICAAAHGFVYLVATVGTTGERSELPPELSDLVEAAKTVSQVPVAVGFGIGTPQQAARVGKVADGVIIGSRLVRAAGEGATPEGAAAAVADFLRQTRVALAAPERGSQGGTRSDSSGPSGAEEAAPDFH